MYSNDFTIDLLLTNHGFILIEQKFNDKYYQSDYAVPLLHIMKLVYNEVIIENEKDNL